MARPQNGHKRIIGLVKEQGRITTNDVVAIFGVHRTTAEKYLCILSRWTRRLVICGTRACGD
ncbi:hypothetical protein ABT88_12030 [Salmonella enterica subsp. enterica serovar Typhimurium]|nr:hypothetical protein ABT88_12030 [Salmonella enterica subsp. enterica serovar Typhimurium]